MRKCRLSFLLFPERHLSEVKIMLKRILVTGGAGLIGGHLCKQLLDEEIDTLVLGCTHYPILKESIQKVVGDNIVLVDSAEAVTQQLYKILPNKENEGTGEDHFFVSDNEDKFRQIASRILNTKISKLIKVNLGESWYLS